MIVCGMSITTATPNNNKGYERMRMKKCRECIKLLAEPVGNGLHFILSVTPLNCHSYTDSFSHFLVVVGGDGALWEWEDIVAHGISLGL